ncbi:MAG: DUF4328 domain-containing protein [Asticcacaulis sp.]|nr:DUF4328 domain-containing protein [Asticcacaulis sp.]
MAKPDTDVGAPGISSIILRTLTMAMIVIIMALLVTLDLGLFQAPSWAYGILQPLFWAQLVVLMVWTARANRYLQEVANPEPDNGAVMAGFSYIIPIMSLWKPYGVMREIYKASRDPQGWQEAKQASIIGWWWACYLTGSLIGAALRFVPNSQSGGPGSDSVVYLGVLLRLDMLAQFVLQFLIVSRVMTWLKRGGQRPAIEQIF